MQPSAIGFTPAARRIGVLDIETVSLDPQDPRGALDAMSGRVACICLLFDDGVSAQQEAICDTDERKLLERFWAALRDTDQLVGHNILAFDLMFIRQRSWILGIKPPITLNLKKYYTEQVVDLMELWTNWSSRFKGASLENIAAALGCGAKSAHGSDVAAWWNARDYGSIVRYCMDDVWLTYRVYCKMHYRQPLGTAQAAPQPLPVFVRDSRELVPVRLAAETTAPAAVNSQGRIAEGYALDRCETVTQAPAVPIPAPAPVPPPPSQAQAPRMRKGKDKIKFMEVQGILVLSGGTFKIAESLKQLGARGGYVKKDGQEKEQFMWQLPANLLGRVAAICSEHNIQLVAA